MSQVLVMITPAAQDVHPPRALKLVRDQVGQRPPLRLLFHAARPCGARGGPGCDAHNLEMVLRLARLATLPHSKWDTYLQLAERTTVHFVLAAYLELLMTFGFRAQLDFFSTEWMSHVAGQDRP